MCFVIFITVNILNNDLRAIFARIDYAQMTESRLIYDEWANLQTLL